MSLEINDYPSGNQHCPPCGFSRLEQLTLSDEAEQRAIRLQQGIVQYTLEHPDDARADLRQEEEAVDPDRPIAQLARAAVECGELIEAGKCFFFSADMITPHTAILRRKKLRS